jgi:hypothetical protein
MAVDFYLLARGVRFTAKDRKKIEQYTMCGNVMSSRGTTYDRMIHAIEKMGIRCRRIRVEGNGSKLASLRDAVARNHPVILGCVTDIEGERWRHYVVLTGIDDRYLHIRDPFPGRRPRRIRIDEFLRPGRFMSWGRNRWGIEVFDKARPYPNHKELN